MFDRKKYDKAGHIIELQETHAIRGGGSSQLHVTVGKPVEIMNSEREELRAYADLMRAEARSGRQGWFASYVRAHMASHQLLGQIMRRGQT